MDKKGKTYIDMTGILPILLKTAHMYLLRVLAPQYDYINLSSFYNMQCFYSQLQWTKNRNVDLMVLSQEQIESDSWQLTSLRNTVGGGSACPWVLRVPPGQRINITLFNFARTGGSELLTSDPSVCYELASIQETGYPSKNILTCGTDSRHKNVYVSET